MLGGLSRRQGDGLQIQRLVEHLAGPDLVPIVIFCVNPEHSDAGHPMVAGDAGGKLERGERLEQRERRTAEESSLLAGDDGDGLSVGKLLRRGQRRRRGAAAALLIGNDPGDLRAAPGVGLRPSDGLRPCRRICRIAGKEWRDGGEIVGVVCGEATDPRKPADVDRERGRVR